MRSVRQTLITRPEEACMAFVRSTARAVVCVVALALVATASAEIVTETYEYDAAGRLRGVEWSGTGLGYTYDAAGNLLARSVPEPADGLGAAALAAIVWLARQRRRRRAAGVALALLGGGFAAPAGAHFCKSPNIEMVVGQTLDDVFAIDADFEEDVSLYTTTSINPPGFVTVVPAGPNYQSHDLFVNLQANTVANGTVQIFWDYPPNFASGSCVFNVNVKANGQTTSNADHRNSGLAGDPVNTLTGEFVMQEPPDLVLPGPMPVSFQRYYGSALQRLFVTSKLGVNWRHNYDWTIHFNGNTLTVKDARGRVTRWLQTDTINHVWTQQNNLDLPLSVRQEVLPTENYFHILDPRTNHIYKFGVPEDADRYYLIEIRDGRGNALALTHSLDGELETVTDGLGRTLTFLYRPWNLGGWLQSVSDGTRTVTFTTNGSGLLQGVTDAAGESWAYAYTTNNFDQGLMTSKTWPEGNVPWTQTWDTQSRVATQTTAAGEITTFAYGAGVTTISDPRSNDATLAHDGSGRLTETTDAANRTRAIEYAGAGNRSAVEQPSGARHLRTHDPASQNESSVTNAAGQTVAYQYVNRAVAPGFSFRELTGIAFPDGRSLLYAYDASGNQISFTDRGADTWTRTFNARSQPLTETNPLGATTTWAYAADGTLASITDAAGRTTTFLYDVHKRTTRVTRPGGAFRTFGWDARDRLTSLRTETGATTAFAYDGNGRLVMKVDPGGAVETYGYDAMNRRITRTDRTGAVTNVAWDDLGGPASVELLGRGTYQYTWSDDGRLAEIALPDASPWSLHFDASGRMTGTTNPAGQSESTALDGDDLVTSRTDHAGRTTLFGRDVLGRVVSATDPSGRTESYSYGAEDEVSRVAAGPLDVDFAHDAMGNITQAIDPNGRTWSWAWNTRSLATSATDPLGRVTSFAYDVRDRVSQATYPGGLGNVQVTYDGVGNAIRRLHSDGVDIGYTLDAHGRLTAAPGVTLGYDARHRVTSSNGIAATRTPHVGQVATLTLAPGKTVTYAYDAAGRPASVTDWLGGTTVFVHDAAGQLTGIERPSGVDTTLGYDAAGRITSIAHGALGAITITRDAAGRPATAVRDLPTAAAPASAASFSYDVASQVSGSGWSYDAMGRRTSGGGRSYAWDLASRLTQIVEGATTTTLGWDAFGRLVSLDRGATNRAYVWNYALPFPAIAIETEDGAPLRHFVHHPSGRLLYWVDVATDARHFPHFDERGNTVFVTNGAGAVEVSFAYAPYGSVATSKTGADVPHTFLGEWGGHALGGGLHVLGRRVYDADTAAFLSRDPVHPHLHPLTFNPYQYAGRDPMTRIDPMGADPVDADAANQNASGQGVLDTARNALSTATGVSDIAGAELGAAAEDTARAASRALGASDSLSGAAFDFIEANLGGNSTSKQVLKRADEYMSEFKNLDARADKLAGQSRTLKAVGAAGTALTAVDIGVELHKLFDKIFEAHAMNDAIEIGLYRTYVNQSTAAWEIYERGKQNEYWLRRKLIDIQYNLKYQLLWQGYSYSLENHINFWTAVGNIYGAFVPGFGFVGTEGVANAAHKHVWTPVFNTLGNPWD
jgi:RHS repeat-associated protein